MAIPITIPRLGWNMEEGIFVGWLRRDGDPIQAGQALFTLESEKATEDVECLDSGILRISADSPKPGDPVKVGDLIGYLVGPGEKEVPAIPSQESLLKPDVVKGAVPVSTSGKVERTKIVISPRARRTAEELGVDWKNLKGTGRTGRIREQDVRNAIKALKVRDESEVGDSRITPTRRVIAERMRHSLSTTAPVTLTTTADATNLVDFRQEMKTRQGEKAPGFTDFFVKLAAVALAGHPRLNSRWENDGIVQLREIHIGIAVDTEAGLMAPVIRDVPELTLDEVADRSRDLIDRTRKGTLKIKEMEGGTFTITNLGAFGVDVFTPIIHWPQCAILGIGQIRRQPVVVNDQVVVRDQFTLSLTFDHRIADGADAARFLQTLVALIEEPAAALARVENAQPPGI
jgi:pyruvate dehydrogenase E2 component (dihydrolipoyllysine-residue acetyltransferase)